MKKHGITVDCAHCRYAGGDSCGGFDVEVPVADDQGHAAGTATLHCMISREHHQVEMTRWSGTDGQTAAPAEGIQGRLNAALDFVAEQRLCGNRKLCPSQVVDIAASFESFEHR